MKFMLYNYSTTDISYKKSQMDEFTVAFVGLPYSGKSTLINSLIDKKINDSKVYKPTTEAAIIDTVIIDDNNNKFKVIDTPGIRDINILPYEYILQANLIFWVSDAINAFTTSDEVNKFNKLIEFLNKKSLDCVQSYDIGIILTSSVAIDSKHIKRLINLIDRPSKNIKDLYGLIDEHSKHIKIMSFNVFGRIYHHEKSNDVNKTLIRPIVGFIPTRRNINFDITDYINTYPQRRQEHILNIMHYEFPIYLLHPDSVYAFNRIIEIYKLLDKQLVLSFLNITFANYDKMEWSAFKFLNYIYDTYSIFDRDIVSSVVFNRIYLNYLIKVVTTNSYSKSINLVKDYDSKNIKFEFINCKKNDIIYFNTFIFDNIFKHLKTPNEIKYMLLDLYEIDMIHADFIFIKQILYTAFKFKNTYDIICIYNWLVDNITSNIRLSTLNYEIIHNKIIDDILMRDIHTYLVNLHELVNNKYYILLNKAYVYRLLYDIKHNLRLWRPWGIDESYDKNILSIPILYHYEHIIKQSYLYTICQSRIIKLLDMSIFYDIINIGINNIYDNLEYTVVELTKIKPSSIEEVMGDDTDEKKQINIEKIKKIDDMLKTMRVDI